MPLAIQRLGLAAAYQVTAATSLDRRTGKLLVLLVASRVGHFDVITYVAILFSLQGLSSARGGSRWRHCHHKAAPRINQARTPCPLGFRGRTLVRRKRLGKLCISPACATETIRVEGKAARTSCNRAIACHHWPYARLRGQIPSASLPRSDTPCWGFSCTCGATPGSHPHLAQRASSDLCRASLNTACLLPLHHVAQHRLEIVEHVVPVNALCACTRLHT